VLESGLIGTVLFAVYALACWQIALTREDRDLLAAGLRRVRRGLQRSELSTVQLASDG
jgi:hypothetical protein